MKLNIKNETGKLKSVVLGQPKSMGGVPTLEESYDAKSYYTLQHGNYPVENDITAEMTAFETILKKYNLTLSAEVVVTTNGNYPRVFVTEIPTETAE